MDIDKKGGHFPYSLKFCINNPAHEVIPSKIMVLGRKLTFNANAYELDPVSYFLFALKNNFMRSEASSASSPVKTCALGWKGLRSSVYT